MDDSNFHDFSTITNNPTENICACRLNKMMIKEDMASKDEDESS